MFHTTNRNRRIKAINRAVIEAIMDPKKYTERKVSEVKDELKDQLKIDKYDMLKCRCVRTQKF